MKTRGILFAGTQAAYAREPIIDGKNSHELVLEAFRKVSEIDDIVVLSTAAEPAHEGIFSIVRETWTMQSLMLAIREAASGYDTIVFAFADATFLSSERIQSLLHRHRSYRADFTFADGYPSCQYPEIADTKIMDALVELSAKIGPEIPDDPLFTVIQKDINAFDIDTDIAPRDFRPLRLRCRPDSYSNLLLLRALAPLFALDTIPMYDEIVNNRAKTRTVPSYYQIAVSERCPTKCPICPYPAIAGDRIVSGAFMQPSNFARLVEEIEELSHEAIVSLSLFGEPALHPEIDLLIKTVLAKPGLSCLIETSGLGWNGEILDRILAMDTNRQTWIVSLDAFVEPTYTKLRGSGFETTKAFAESLLGKIPGRTYVQAVRNRENEDELEEFYRYWKAKTEHVIVQKYDSFAGALPDLLVTDLSPIQRNPCWHIARDMCILVNGDVPPCRADLRQEATLGNVFREKLSDIWARGAPRYGEHVNSHYSGPCGRCDEYYTYNF